MSFIAQLFAASMPGISHFARMLADGNPYAWTTIILTITTALFFFCLDKLKERRLDKELDELKNNRYKK